jgi:hypothetical protein
MLERKALLAVELFRSADRRGDDAGMMGSAELPILAG